MNTFLTVFSTPKPFTNPHIAVIQTNALNSWVRLGEEVKVLLVGSEEGVPPAARKAGVTLIPEVERNHLGTPLISSIFQLARENTDSPLLAYVNADILLTTDFIRIARMVAEELSRFLIVGRRWDLEITELLDFSGKWEARLRELVEDKARLHPAGGSDYFIFPRDCFQSIPPMAIGRAGWDNWMIYEARRQKWPVVDATSEYQVIHQQHDYSHLPEGKPHYRLPESNTNVKHAGGRHAIYTLADANRILVEGKVRRAPLNIKRFLREVEISPVTRLNCVWAGRVVHAIFHPVRTYWHTRAWLGKALKNNKTR